MTAVDPDFNWRYQTWLRFTRLIRYAIAGIVILLIAMAYFLL